MEPKKRILYHCFDEEIQNTHINMWGESLWDRLIRFSENFHNENRNGSNSWVITSPEVVNIINNIERGIDG
jgi:hypothetical protein